MLLSFILVSAVFAACSNSYPDATVPPGFCARQWASGLQRPRGVWVADNGDLLVVEAGPGAITALWDSNNDGFSDKNERAVLVTLRGLNHGITVHGDYLYATSPSTVYRWKYAAADRKVIGGAQVVVQNIPSDGHTTRTPVFDSNGNLYVSLGSAGNVDNDPSHAQVRLFDLQSTFPIEWRTGYIWASGLRNEVGLTFDSADRLWGVMNGMDSLHRADLGGDIHNMNPAEELNLLTKGGSFYGYPYCWAEYDLGKYGHGAGTMWAHEKFMNDGVHTDAWCQNSSNVLPPALALQPHTAPLDIKFWHSGSWGTRFAGDAFIAQHGSWNRDPPHGYRVITVKFVNGHPHHEEPFLYHDGPAQRWPSGFRPVGLAQNHCGDGSMADCLFVTSDATGEIVYVKYENTSSILGNQ